MCPHLALPSALSTAADICAEYTPTGPSHHPPPSLHLPPCRCRDPAPRSRLHRGLHPSLPSHISLAPFPCPQSQCSGLHPSCPLCLEYAASHPTVHATSGVSPCHSVTHHPVGMVCRAGGVPLCFSAFTPGPCPSSHASLGPLGPWALSPPLCPDPSEPRGPCRSSGGSCRARGGSERGDRAHTHLDQAECGGPPPRAFRTSWACPVPGAASACAPQVSGRVPVTPRCLSLRGATGGRRVGQGSLCPKQPPPGSVTPRARLPQP